MFAGGDAKLMIALGTVLPFSESFFENLEFFSLFLILFLFVGGIYGLIWGAFLTVNNFNIFKKEFVNQFNRNQKMIYAIMIFALFVMVLGFFEKLVFYLGLLIFIMPYLYVYARTIDDSCLIKTLNVKKLEEGDWLYKELKVGKKIIKANWSGLNKKHIKEIQKNFKKIKIREGIPFVPTFLISFLTVVYFYFNGISLLGLF